MATRRDALMFVCPWLTEGDADAILQGEDDAGPTLVERLAHHEAEHREWMHVAMNLWREATGSEAPWPGSAKALAQVRASLLSRTEASQTASETLVEEGRDGDESLAKSKASPPVDPPSGTPRASEESR